MEIPRDFASLYPMLVAKIFEFLDLDTLLPCMQNPYLIKFVPESAKDRLVLFDVPISTKIFRWLQPVIDFELADREPRWLQSNKQYGNTLKILWQGNGMDPFVLKKRKVTIKFFEDGVPIRVYGPKVDRSVMDELSFSFGKDEYYFSCREFHYNPKLVCYEKREPRHEDITYVRNSRTGRIVPYYDDYESDDYEYE